MGENGRLLSYFMVGTEGAFGADGEAVTWGSLLLIWLP